MIQIFLLFAAWFIGLYLNQTRRLAFQIAAKPYPKPKPKPKTPKKLAQDLFALVKYAGNGAISISGKIGGTVFTPAGVYGPFIRNWDKPRRVRNAATTLVRGVFSGVSSAYRTLTPTQVATWVAAKADFIRKNVFGDIKHLTPNNIFERVNNTLTSLGLANITDAPTVASTDSVTALDGAADESAATFTIDPTLFSAGVALPANVFAKVYATRQVNPSKQSFGKSDYRLISIFNPATAFPLDIAADYTAKFGPLVADKNISVAIELIYATIAPNQFAMTGKTYATVTVVA